MERPFGTLMADKAGALIHERRGRHERRVSAGNGIWRGEEDRHPE
jgi:hypothetical protein